MAKTSEQWPERTRDEPGPTVVHWTGGDGDLMGAIAEEVLDPLNYLGSLVESGPARKEPDEKPKQRKWLTLATTGKWVPWRSRIPPTKNLPGPWTYNETRRAYTNPDTPRQVSHFEQLVYGAQFINGWLVREVKDE